jgi:hypothetical protein
MRWDLLSGISSGFPELSQSQGQVAHVLLTRSPLGTARCCHRTDLARLACVRHAASVRPEPGSNSPSEIVELSEAHAEAGAGDFALIWNSATCRSPRLTIPSSELGGWAMPGITPWHRWCWLIRLPGCSIEPSSGRSRAGTWPAHALPHGDGVQSTGFSHTVEFSRSLVGVAPRDSPVVPDQGPVAGAAVTVSRAFQVRQPSDLSPPVFPGRSPTVSPGPVPVRRSRRRLPYGPPSFQRQVRPSVFPRVPLSRYLLPPGSRHRGAGSWVAARTADSGPRTPVLPSWGLWRHLALSTSHRRAALRLLLTEASGRPPPAVGSSPDGSR